MRPRTHRKSVHAARRGAPPLLTGAAAAPVDTRTLVAWGLAALVGFIALVVYLPTVRFDLLIWDDYDNITRNPYLHPPSWSGLLQFWAKPYVELYIPVVYTGYVAETAISGGQPWLFHLTNVLLHALSAALVFRIVWRLVPDQAAALLAALVFAVHPLQVEPVAWITGRKDVLSACLLFGALWQHLQWRSGSARGWRYALALLLYALALLSKPAVAAMPLAVLWMDRFVLRRDWSSCARAAAPWFALSAAAVAATAWSQRVHVPVDLWIRPFIAGDAVLFYLRKLLWPVGLSPVYGRTPWKLTSFAAWWLGLPFSALVAALLVRAPRVVKLSAIVFLAGLLPVLGLKAFRYQNYSTVADRYMYVPMLGVCLALAWAMHALPDRRRRISLTVGGVLVVVLGGMTLHQQPVWRSSEALLKRATEIAPQNGAVRSNLASLYMQQGRVDEAITEFTHALALMEEPGVRNNLGLALRQKGRFEEAAQHYRVALKLNPSMASAHDGLAECLLKLGDVAGAIGEYEQALALDPTRRSSRINLGVALTQARRLDEAISQYRAALQARPEAQVYALLARALSAAGRTQEAAQAIREGLRLDPANPQLRALTQPASLPEAAP